MPMLRHVIAGDALVFTIAGIEFGRLTVKKVGSNRATMVIESLSPVDVRHDAVPRSPPQNALAPVPCTGAP